MGILFGILIILIIVIVNNEKEMDRLIKENRELKKSLEYFTEKTTEKNENSMELEFVFNNLKNDVLNQKDIKDKKQKEERKTVEYIEPAIQYDVVNGKYIQESKDKEEFIRQEKNKKEQKNVLILITGAICIVLSAIIFLMSTWGITSNILKTVVLGLLTVVFFKMSNIAKVKYKLEKASQVFYYIAMAYIPICFLSISIFELFGRYLSIYGDGKYIYFTITTLILAYVYYINRKNRYLLYGSILSQVLTVILFTLIFSNNIVLIGINLLIYNLLLMTLTKDDIFVKVYNFIPWAILIIPILEYTKHLTATTFILILLTINFWILALKNKNKIYLYVFNICLMSIGIYISVLCGDFWSLEVCYILSLLYIILIYTLENVILLNSKNNIDSISFVTIGALAILYISNLINNVIPLYIISIVQSGVVIASYINTNADGKKVCGFLVPIYFIISELNIITRLQFSYHAYIIFSILTFCATELIRNRDKLLHFNCFVISHIYILITYLVIYLGNIAQLNTGTIYIMLLMLIYVYSYIIEKKNIFKYVTYIVSNLMLYSLLTGLEAAKNILYYIPTITTLVIMKVERLNKNIKDEGSNVYLGISQVVSFICLYNSLNNLNIVAALILSVIIIIENIRDKEKNMNIIPLICAIPAIFNNDFNFIIKNIIMLLSIMGLTTITIKERKISLYTIFSAIYMLLTIYNIENVYFREVIFIIWSSINCYYIKDEKSKDLFKSLAYVGSLLLYNTIINDINIASYTVINMLGYIVLSITLLRTILNKYITGINIFEYITYSILYIIAICQYNNELDGILFGALLLLIVMISYLKKYSSLFLVSIFSILVNVFILTRKFWFSIPWWGYLLAIGIVLISFAIRNEANDKKNINAMDVLKKIKDKIEE